MRDNLTLGDKVSASLGAMDRWLAKPYRFGGMLILLSLLAFADRLRNVLEDVGLREIDGSGLAYAFFGFDGIVLSAAGLIAGYALITGWLRFSVFIVALAVSALEMNLMVWHQVVHPFVLEHARWLYAPVFWQKPEMVHPDSLKVMMLMPVLAALLVQVLRKKWRTFDRVFATLSLFFLLLTYVAFNAATLIQVHQFERTQKLYLQSVFRTHDFNTANIYCYAEKLECVFLPPERLRDIPEGFPMFAKHALMQIEQVMNAHSSGDLYLVGVDPDNTVTRADGFVAPEVKRLVPLFVGFDTENQMAMLAFDRSSYADNMMFNLRIQAGLTAVAHFVWFYLLIALWVFHRKRFQARAARRAQAPGRVELVAELQ